jgi:hypothetical protein
VRLPLLVFALLVPSVPVLAADPAPAATPEDPSRFADVEEWDVTVTVACEGSNTVSSGPITSTFTPKDHGQGTAHLTTVQSVPLAHLRVLEGKLHGSFTIDEKDVVSMPGSTTTYENKGSGDGGGKVKVVLGIRNDGYEVKIQNSDVAVTTKVTVPGAVDTSEGSVPLDFSGDKNAYPDHGMELSGKKTLTGLEGCTAPGAGAQMNQVVKTASWTLKPVKKMEAKPKIAAAFHRGEQAQLDGSDSSGHPTHFKWTVTPKPCPSIRTASGSQDGSTASPKSKEGDRWAVTLLCDADVKLEVSDDDGNRDEKTIPVTVTARPWKIGFTSDGPTPFRAMLQKGTLVFGQNECTDDGGRHWIHAKPSEAAGGNDWRKLVDFAKVSESDSPFDGWLYASSGEKLHVSRDEHVNSSLYPDGDAFQQSASHGHKKGIQLVQKSTQRHEKLHSTLAQKALEDGEDPLVDVERLAGQDEEALREQVQQTVLRADNALYQASSESKVHAQLEKEGFGKAATINLPDGSAYSIANVAQLGDDASGGN